MIITRAAINEGYDSTHIPSYGPESRGGTSYADVHVARNEVLSPAAPHPHVLVAFNAPSLAKFGPTVRPGGMVIYDSSVIRCRTGRPRRRASGRCAVPFTGVAKDLGSLLVKNVVALGALQGATKVFPEETFLTAICAALKDKCAMIAINEEAFRSWGQARRRTVRLTVRGARAAEFPIERQSLVGVGQAGEISVRACDSGRSFATLSRGGARGASTNAETPRRQAERLCARRSDLAAR